MMAMLFTETIGLLEAAVRSLTAPGLIVVGKPCCNRD